MDSPLSMVNDASAEYKRIGENYFLVKLNAIIVINTNCIIIILEGVLVVLRENFVMYLAEMESVPIYLIYFYVLIISLFRDEIGIGKQLIQT
jgi:hypothetical protein